MDIICHWKEILSTTLFAWIYVLFFGFGLYVCYNVLGSAKYWNIEDSSTMLNYFNKVQYLWKTRLKLFCCCADISEENDLVYVELSTFFASFLNCVDLVPTDILAGIISLSQKHALKRRQNLTLSSCSKTKLLESFTPSWMTAENALYFLRAAKSTYGWLAFFNIFRPWNLCVLYPHAKCCFCCSTSDDNITDNCCYLNSAAVKKITGFVDDDILYGSFSNTIHEPVFYVAVDHKKQSVIIAICGTRSFSDIVTDLDGEKLLFPCEDPKFKCHRGILRSAMTLEKKLNECHVLEMAFAKNPSYTLVLTGHSLGGSVAAFLALMLRSRYPTLQCYAYGPLAVLTAIGIPQTLNCIMSVVVDVDASPRSCVTSIKELQSELIQSLRENNQPKYKILMGATLYNIRKYFKRAHSKPVNEVYENVVYNGGVADKEEINTNQVSDIEDNKLYAPGRILYFERKNWSKPQWITGLNLRDILIHPDMLADHQPHRIQRMLEKFLESNKSDCVQLTLHQQ